RENEKRIKTLFFLLTLELRSFRFLALTDSLRFAKTSVFGTGAFCGENCKSQVASAPEFTESSGLGRRVIEHCRSMRRDTQAAVCDYVSCFTNDLYLCISHNQLNIV